MLVGELMTRRVVAARPETPVTKASALMAKEHIRHLLVTEGGRLLGIVTDRDLR